MKDKSTNSSHNIKTIAFIESNTTGTGEMLIQSALEKNFNVLFLTNHPEKYTFLNHIYLHPVIINTNNIECMEHYLKNLENLTAIISTSERFVHIASILAQKFLLPHTNPTAIEICRDKFKLMQCLNANKISSIKSALVCPSDQNIDILKRFHFPVIVKPNTGTGSINVKLCNDIEQVLSHLEHINLKEDKDAKSNLIQEYIKGNEYSAEIIAINNEYHLLGITKKFLGNEPFFVEIGHEFPALIEKTEVAIIYRHLCKVLETIQYDFGPVHIEFRIQDEEIYIIEINPRLAGGMIPVLIEHAKGIKLIAGLIDLYTKSTIDLTSKDDYFTKIVFLIPEKVGHLQVDTNFEKTKNIPQIVDIKLYKTTGDTVTINGDFSDRIGHVIVKAINKNLCTQVINDIFNYVKTNIKINSINQDDNNTFARNRLTKPLHPNVKKILEWRLFNEYTNLNFLSQINKAHLLMLVASNLLSREKCEIIIKSLNEIEQENFSKIKNFNDPSIGFYLAFEQTLNKILGPDTAGVIHTGRSRNDINATIQRLKTRQIFVCLYDALWRLRSAILQQARKYIDLAMPIYSQYQVAMPATYGYYLLAIENSLALQQSNLNSLIDILNTSPLGAASGAGTSFPINPAITAKYLGFTNSYANALTAVSSRDLELMLLSNASLIGVIISRVAHDFQLWTTQEFNFFELPDDLCGISSSMPQKKNPYLLEKIKGKAIATSGNFFTSLTIMSKTPYSNSLEVGTEALLNYVNGLEELVRSIELLKLIIAGAEPNPKNMLRSSVQGLSVATAISESLVKENIINSYRQAHEFVGETISDAIINNQSPLDKILLMSANINKDPTSWHIPFEYGNGPGKNSTTSMLDHAIMLLELHGKFIYSHRLAWNEADDILLKSSSLIS